MEEQKTIYLDYAANTPVDEEVLSIFNETTLKYYGNPNSNHHLGTIAKEQINIAEKKILNNFKEKYHIEDDMELIYTSGASESNNLAIKGVAKAYREYGKHVITTFLEHSSVSGPLTRLKEQGYEIDLLNVNQEGKVDLNHLRQLLRKDTILVSIASVDSEIGTIQPIQEIAKMLKEYPNCFFHVDCTQSIGKINMNLEGADFISFAPHKFYGLNGFGGLLKKKGIALEPLIHGGTSTTIYRSGTPVTGQIVAMERAVELAIKNQNYRYQYVEELNITLRNQLKQYEKVQINTMSQENPYILNLSIKGVKAVDFKQELEKYGVCISIKSACSSVISPSRSVMAITHDRKRALSSWRISLSHLVTKEEIEEFLKIFDICYQKLCKEEGN
ncbi:MAG: cysteine desulfurase [Clostridia bacterium]|nr:cysteine desulfurase [Clostridia bacterium]